MPLVRPALHSLIDTPAEYEKADDGQTRRGAVMHASIILAICSMAAAMTWLVQIHDWSAMLTGLTDRHFPQAFDRLSDEISLI